MTIKRVGPLSCAKIAGVTYAGLGLLIGAPFSLLASLGGLALFGGQHSGDGTTISPLLGMGLGLGAVVVFPIAYGLLGFVFALIGAWLYNLAAGLVGGIELDVS